MLLPFESRGGLAFWKFSEMFLNFFEFLLKLFELKKKLF